jgi:hypothetical protein
MTASWLDQLRENARRMDAAIGDVMPGYDLVTAYLEELLAGFSPAERARLATIPASPSRWRPSRT